MPGRRGAYPPFFVLIYQLNTSFVSKRPMSVRVGVRVGVGVRVRLTPPLCPKDQRPNPNRVFPLAGGRG